MTIAKRLYLLRHAKAAPGDASMADHDRPLAPRGAEDAVRLGRHFSQKHAAPELILVSTARRTVETTALVAEFYKPQPVVAYEPGLYSCGSDALLRRLHEIEPEVGGVMIVAHNPDLHELAISLAAEGEAAQLATMRRKFPPGALAVLTFGLSAWSAIRPGSARLDEFTSPNDLA